MYWMAQVKFWVIFGIFILVLVLDYQYGISRTNFTFKTFEMLFVFFLGFLFFPIVWKLQGKLIEVNDNLQADADAAKLGMEGEKNVAVWLNEHLPKDTYSIISNVQLPGHKFDIDFVIIGPKGIIVLEVKNFSDKVYFSEDEYFKIIDGQKYFLPVDDDPRVQARRHSDCLKKYFELKGAKGIKISKAVVFIKPDACGIEGKMGVFIISGREKLKQYLNSLENCPDYTPDFCNKLVQQLKCY